MLSNCEREENGSIQPNFDDSRKLSQILQFPLAQNVADVFIDSFLDSLTYIRVTQGIIDENIFCPTCPTSYAALEPSLCYSVVVILPVKKNNNNKNNGNFICVFECTIVNLATYRQFTNAAGDWIIKKKKQKENKTKAKNKKISKLH